jgi:hypothetical protein
MASYAPPVEDVPIFNLENWTVQDTNGLTEAEGDLRYLLKKQPDVATALETFNQGISTNSILAYGGNLSIGNIGSTIYLYGNTVVANVSNLDVFDAQITVNKGGLVPTNAGIQVDSSNIIVSSLLNDANADWVLSSSNNRIYLDSIGEKTANATITAINPITINDGSGSSSQLEPAFLCVQNGSDRGGMKLTPSTDFCMGTFNALDLHIKTNNTNRIDIDGTNGNVTISSTLPSTGSTTGALVVAGGVGVGGNYYSAGSGYFNGGDLGTLTNTNLSLKTNNTVRAQINGSSGDFYVTSSTSSSSTTAGAIRTLGGISCVKGVHIGEGANIGNTTAYALFLNSSIGVGNIGCSIQNSGNGNTVIQPQHQGVAWRNTYLNNSGGLVAIGSSTPPNATDKLYVNGTSNINGSLFVVNDSNVFNETVRGNLIVSGNIIGNISPSNILGNLTVNNQLFVKSTNLATDTTTTGAIVCSGGISLAKNIYAGGDLQTAGNIITSSNTDNALQIIGGGSITKNLFVTGNIQGNANITISGSGNITNSTGNIISGKLLVGTNAPFENAPVKIQNSTSLDTAVNGTVSGNVYNLLALTNSVRSFVFGGGDGSDNVALYLGGSGGVANDPDMFCRWDTNGRMMIYPPASGNIVGPNSGDLFTCRGNANISSNLTVIGTANISGNIRTTNALTTLNNFTTGRFFKIDSSLSNTVNIKVLCKDGSTQDNDVSIACQNGNSSTVSRGNCSIFSDYLFYGSVAHTPTEFKSYANENTFTGNITTNAIQFNTQPQFVMEKGILASGTTAITFVNNFTATPSLICTALDTTNSGIIVNIVDIDSNGANIRLKNTGNSVVSRIVHYIAMGNI